MGFFNRSDKNPTTSSPRQEKAIYEYKMMEQVDCDLDTAIKNPNPGFQEYCKIIAESTDYKFYSYKTHSDSSGGYVIRRSKANPKETLFFGENHQLACVFQQYLILCDHSGQRGRFYIHARNIITGFEQKCDWLGQGDLYVVVNGYGRFFVQDSIKDIRVEGARLVFNIQRKKSNHNEPEDKHNIDTEYQLIVTQENRQLKPVAVFDAEEELSSPKKKTSEIDQLYDPKAHGLGRTESRHVSCMYKGRESECPKECSSCEISIKTDADLALSRGSVDEAISLYERAVALEPRFAEAWVNMANAYGMNRDYEKSVAAFDKAIAIDPKYGKALFGKAITLKNLGRTSEAQELAQLVNLLYPGNESVLVFIKELETKKPIEKPVSTVPSSDSHTDKPTEKTAPAPTGWQLMCSYSVSLWHMNSEKEIKDCGAKGDASILQNGEFLAPLLKIENCTGFDLPAFTVDYVIDNIQKGNWQIKPLAKGITQLLWITNKVPQIAHEFGMHTISYSILGNTVCSFSWTVENHSFDWLTSLSSSAMLKMYKDNTFVKKVGLLGRKSLLEKEQYYCPVLCLHNTLNSNTPSFEIECTTDGNSGISWGSCSLKAGETRYFNFSEETARRYMNIGKVQFTRDYTG